VGWIQPSAAELEAQRERELEIAQAIAASMLLETAQARRREFQSTWPDGGRPDYSGEVGLVADFVADLGQRMARTRAEQAPEIGNGLSLEQQAVVAGIVAPQAAAKSNVYCNGADTQRRAKINDG
jgi:hypothetical protein